jgi:hypothetical protein
MEGTHDYQNFGEGCPAHEYEKGYKEVLSDVCLLAPLFNEN